MENTSACLFSWLYYISHLLSGLVTCKFPWESRLTQRDDRWLRRFPNVYSRNRAVRMMKHVLRYRAILVPGKIHSLLFVGKNIWIQIFVVIACPRNLKQNVRTVSPHYPPCLCNRKGTTLWDDLYYMHLYNWSLVSILSPQHCQWNSSLWELVYNLFYFFILPFCICFIESEHCFILWFYISPPKSWIYPIVYSVE